MPLTRTDFDQWAGRHGAMFGFAHPNDPAMFSLWFDLFAGRGYSQNELRYATDAIAARSEPLKWREHHLAEINRSIAERRAARQAQYLREHPDAEIDYGRCSSCLGSGWVSVPHPRQVVNGLWEPAGMHGHAEAVVSCNCSSGRVRLDKWDEAGNDYQKRIARPMTLEHYESRICQNWRAILKQHAAKLDKISKAKSLSEVADKSKPLRAVVQRVLDKAAAT